MKRNEWITVIVVVVVVAVLASFLTSQLTGQVIGRSRAVRANSCDADTICEVAKTVSTAAGSGSALLLTSDAKQVFVDGSVAVTGSLSSPKLTGGGTALVLTSGTKQVFVDGSLSSTNLVGTGNAYVCVGSNGVIYRSLTACNGGKEVGISG